MRNRVKLNLDRLRKEKKYYILHSYFIGLM